MAQDLPNDPLAHFVGYLEAQRQATRAQEDSVTDQKISILHDMIKSPGANPARTAQALDDILTLYSSKGKGAKPKKGMAGFMGESEVPTSQILSGLIHGSIPMQGPTTESVPRPQSPVEQGMMPEASGRLPGLQGFDGKEVLNSPVMIPPQPLQAPPEATGMLSAARDMQRYNTGPKTRPVANQPMMRSNEELMAESQMAERGKQKAATAGVYDADLELAQKMQSQPEGVQDDLRGMKNIAKPNATANRTAAHNATVDGKRQVVWVDPVNKVISDASGNPVNGDIILEGTGATAGSAFQQHLVQKPDGTYEAIYVPKTPSAAGDPSGVSSVDTGVVGKLPAPPQGSVQIIADPSSGNAAPYKVTGTTATPIKIAGTDGPQAMKPITPEKMSAAGKQALLGINTIGSMIEPLMDDLQSAGLTNNPVGQSWNLFLAKHGISPGQEEEQLLQLLGIADAYGLRGLMGGRPNMKLMDIVRVHLPQPGDSTQLSWDKLHTLAGVMPKLRQAIIDSETTQIPRRTPYGVSATAPEVGGDIPSAPGKNPFRP